MISAGCIIYYSSNRDKKYKKIIIPQKIINEKHIKTSVIRRVTNFVRGFRRRQRVCGNIDTSENKKTWTEAVRKPWTAKSHNISKHL